MAQRKKLSETLIGRTITSVKVDINEEVMTLVLDCEVEVTISASSHGLLCGSVRRWSQPQALEVL